MREFIRKLLEYCPSSLKNLNANVVLLTGNTDDEFVADPQSGPQGLEDTLVALYDGGAERIFTYSLLRGLRPRKQLAPPESSEKPVLEAGENSLDLNSLIASTMRNHAKQMGRQSGEVTTGPYVNNPADALREIDRNLAQTRRVFVFFQYSPVIQLVGDGAADLAPILESLPNLCRERGHLVVFAGTRSHPILTQIYTSSAQKVLSVSIGGPSGHEIEAALLEEEVRQRRAIVDCASLPDVVSTLEHLGNQAHSGLKTVVDNVLRAPGSWLDSAWVKENGSRGLDLQELDIEGIDHVLRSEIIGQDHVKGKVVKHLKHLRHFERESSRPFMRLLFVGPSGVGKTEIAKILCRKVFGSEKPLLLVACAEYSQAHEVAKLLGAPPGYTGHDAPALLESHRRQYPAGLLLLDEFEKAHPDVHRFFMNILEEGRATSPRSEEGSPIVLDFSNYIIVATTNAGNREIDGLAGSGHGGPTAERQSRYLVALKTMFPLELLGRFDQLLVFDLLSGPEFERIARHYGERQILAFFELCRKRSMPQPEVAVRDELYRALASTCDRALGARNLRRIVEETFKRLWLEKYAEMQPQPAKIEFGLEDFRGHDE